MFIMSKRLTDSNINSLNTKKVTLFMIERFTDSKTPNEQDD